MSPVESVAVMSTLESTVVPIEEAIVSKKFGEMELPEEEEEDVEDEEANAENSSLAEPADPPLKAMGLLARRMISFAERLD